MKPDCRLALLSYVMSVPSPDGRRSKVDADFRVEMASCSAATIKPLGLVVDEDATAGGALAWSSNAEAPLPPPVPGSTTTSEAFKG